MEWRMECGRRREQINFPKTCEQIACRHLNEKFYYSSSRVRRGSAILTFIHMAHAHCNHSHRSQSVHSLHPASENSWNEIKQKFQFLTHKNGKNVLIFSHSSLFPCCIRRKFSNIVDAVMIANCGCQWKQPSNERASLICIVPTHHHVSMRKRRTTVKSTLDICWISSDERATSAAMMSSAGNRKETKMKFKLSEQRRVVGAQRTWNREFSAGKQWHAGPERVCFIRWNAFFWLPFLFSKSFQIIKHLQQQQQQLAGKLWKCSTLFFVADDNDDVVSWQVKFSNLKIYCFKQSSVTPLLPIPNFPFLSSHIYETFSLWFWIIFSMMTLQRLVQAANESRLSGPKDSVFIIPNLQV